MQMGWVWLCAGLVLGALAAAPVAAAAATRRAARRVRRLEQRTRSAERLAELGSMTGGLAHEIKNPLSTIGLNHQLLNEDLKELSRQVESQGLSTEAVKRVQRRFDTVSREAERLRNILEDFLRFAGRMRLQRQASDVNELIDEVCDFFGPQAEAAGVRIRVECARELPSVAVDGGLMKQAILNLMVNAVQIMREARDADRASGGCHDLILRTQSGRVGGEEQVRIHVIDTGPGIAAEDVEKVFQPYFSRRKGGTGLGLPTTRRIVEEHGGQVEVHTAEGRGSDFELRLPVRPPEEPHETGGAAQ